MNTTEKIRVLDMYKNHGMLKTEHDHQTFDELVDLLKAGKSLNSFLEHDWDNLSYICTEGL
jgi:hypothetical protein